METELSTFPAESVPPMTIALLPSSVMVWPLRSRPVPDEPL